MIQQINPTMIALAREARGLTQQDLGQRINLHKANISRLENGETGVHIETLMAIAEATNYPPQFFAQTALNNVFDQTYRKREKVPSKLLSSIEAQMNIIRKHVQVLTRALDIELRKLPASQVIGEQTPVKIARLIREKWNITDPVIENLSDLLEQHGIIINSFDFTTERVDSRTMFTEDKYPIIFVNSSLLGDRLRYSMAYELAGLIMHCFTSVSEERDLSREANQFAAEFLMPENAILKDFEQGVTLPRLAELKRKWKVSMISLLYRADDLGLLTPNQKRYLIQQFNQQNIRRREPPELDIPVERPQLMRSLLKKYMSEYEININQLLTILAISPADYLNYYG